MGSTPKNLLWVWHELLSHRWVIFRHLFWKKLTEVTAHRYTSIYLECFQRQAWNMGRWPPNSKQCSPWCCSGHGLLPSPLGVDFISQNSFVLPVPIKIVFRAHQPDFCVDLCSRSRWSKRQYHSGRKPPAPMTQDSSDNHQLLCEPWCETKASRQKALAIA